MRIDPQIYGALFDANPDGRKVFEELCTQFYDRQSYVRGDTHETAFNEGAKSVIQYIMRKVAQAKQPNNGDIEE